MKKLPIVATLLLITFAFACKKSADVSIPPSETPVKTTYTQKIVYDTVEIFPGSYEFGYKFYSSKNGKISQLGCLAPVKGNIRVSLWDFDSKDLITAVTINSDSTSFQYVDIPAVSIVANKRYVISLNSHANGVSRYSLGRKKPSSNIYPFSSGSVTFEALQQIESTTSKFPAQVLPTSQVYLGGFSDFKLQVE
jgi:hypothetical protein